MGMEWKEVLATDFCLEVTDGTHDSPKPKEEGHFLVTSKHLQGFDIDFTKAYKISEEDYQKVVSRSRVEQYDILFSMIGTIGNIHRVTIPIVDFAVKNVGIFKFGGDDLRSRWLYYWFKSPFANEYINSTLAGSTQSYLTLKSLRNFPIMVPKMEEMKRIVDILSSLDAKIENNNKINAKLEEMAQALFKCWFIDFEPFKVGRDGSRPVFGSGNFVESELGLIPEGWKVGKLGDICEKVTDGSHFSPKDSIKDNIPMLSVKDMSKFGFDYSSCKHITEEDYEKMKASDCVPKLNDILVAKDGSYLKEIFICKEEIKQAILSSIAIFRPLQSVILPEYLLMFLKSPNVLHDVRENYVSGSAVPRIVLKDFKKLPIVIPNLESQKRAFNTIAPLLDKIYQLSIEIVSLTQTRDTLLPKLMSGEIEL